VEKIHELKIRIRLCCIPWFRETTSASGGHKLLQWFGLLPSVYY